MILEACVGTIHDAIVAERNGAHQIELCDRLDLDGTSPPFDLVKAVVEALSIPVKVIVNPNPFVYHYTEKDIDSILIYIEHIASYNIKGIVCGPIDKYGSPDLKAVERVQNITDLPITYHKAIDASPDILQSAAILKEHGSISSILSSGGSKTAKEGAEVLLEMKKLLSGSSIDIIAAGKITKENLWNLHEALGLKYYHGKLIV